MQDWTNVGRRTFLHCSFPWRIDQLEEIKVPVRQPNRFMLLLFGWKQSSLVRRHQTLDRGTSDTAKSLSRFSLVSQQKRERVHHLDFGGGAPEGTRHS